MAAKLNASWAGSTEGAPGLAPEGNAAVWLQADGAAARLVQCVALEDDVAVGVGHQQVQAKVEASPAPAVLQDTGDTEGTQPEDGLCHASSEGQSWQWGSAPLWGVQGSLPTPFRNREPSGDSLNTAGDYMRASECQLPPRQTGTHTTPVGVKQSALGNGADLRAPAMP